MRKSCLIAGLLIALVACGEPKAVPAQTPAIDPTIRELPPAQPSVSPPPATEPVTSFLSNPQRRPPTTEEDQVHVAADAPTPIPFAFNVPQPPGELRTMEERIVDADLIAIARMTNVASEVESVDYGEWSGYVGALKFTFNIKEILKSPAGSSPTQVIGMVSSTYPFQTRAEAQTVAQKMFSGRDTQWDNRDALIFLASSSTHYPATAADNVYFMSFIDYFTGIGDSYSIASLDLRIWLPEAQTGTEGGARTAAFGRAQSSTNRRFLTGVPEQAPAQAQVQGAASTSDETPSTSVESPSVALSNLRADITRLVAEQRTDTSLRHQRCVSEKYRHKRHSQEYAAKGELYDPVHTFNQEISSGAAAGTEVLKDTWKSVLDPGVWESQSELQGPNAGLFRLGALSNPDPGSHDWTNTIFAVKQTINYTYYDQPIETVRPLPRGVYELTWKYTRSMYVPCAPELARDHTVNVTVTAPIGTVHEALFDPVTDGSAVAADSSNGQLDPATFIHANGASATVQRIEWASNTVKMKVNPHTGLAGHKLDFIELDGTVSLSLQVDDATVDAANRTLSWSVAEQPWHDGDKLMLRIAELVTEVDLVNVPPTITQGQSASVTVRATDLSSSNSYTIRLTSDNFGIGFDNDCGAGSTMVRIPSGSASHSAAIPLEGCHATSSTVTANLKQGTSTVATATAEVEVEASTNVTVTLSPREEQYGTYTNLAVQWNDPSGCVGRYYVGIFNSQETVVNNLGYHPAPQTTTLSENLGRSWASTPPLDWFVKVRCHPSDPSRMTIVGQASLQSGLPSTP